MVIRSSVDNILIATNGTKGQPGPAGTSSYIHIKYSNDGGKTFTDNDGETIGAYIGIYRDFTENDSSKVTDYKWKKIEGEDGSDAYTVMLSNENFTISTDANYIPIHTQTYRCNVVVLKGVEPIDFTIDAATDTEGDIVTTVTGHDVTIKVAPVDVLSDTQGTISLTITADSQSFTKDITWSVATKGDTGKDGKDGTSVSITATSVDYAISASATVTPADSEWGELKQGTTEKPYIWTRTTVHYSDNKQTVSYSVAKQGIDGTNGTDGKPGKDGTNGKNSFVHIKYAAVENPTDEELTETPSEYIGICYNEEAADPTTAASYSWSKWMGQDGAQGQPGKNGTDGKNSYVHFAYSTSADGSEDFSVTAFEGAKYIGILIDENQDDSMDYHQYEWSLIKGEDGTSVTIKSTSVQYAISNSATVTPESGEWGDLKQGTKDKPYVWTRTIVTYSDGKNTITYTVARQGIDGTNGTDGKPGKDGKDGTSTYVHIKYSAVAEPTDEDMTEAPSDYIGICHDLNVEDPTTASSYTWSKWVGEDGPQGQPGKDGTNGKDSYTHFAYANSADGSEDFSTSSFAGAKYIGIRVDEVKDDSTDYKDYTWNLIKGSDGNDGVSITKVINHYLATSASSDVTTKTTGWTTTIQTITKDKQYLWNYEEIQGSNDKTISTTTPVIIGRYGVDGVKGDTGRGIKSIVEHYQVSSSNTEPPTTWSETMVNTTTTNKYLWNYETITYSDDKTEDTTKRVIGTHGATGTSVTVKSTEYQAGTSNTQAPTGTWSKTPVAVTEGNYLWTKVTYSDGKVAYSVAKQGRTGDTGRGVKSITEYFLLSADGDSSKITLPEKDDKHGWTTVGEALIWSKNKPYLWHCTEVVYENSDGSEDYVYVDLYADTGWKAADLVQANLTSFQQGVDNVIDRDNQSIRSAVWENTYTYKPKKDAEGNYIYDDDGKIVPDEDTKTTMSEYMAESIVDRDGIRTKVEEAESSIDGLERKSSEIEQTADKINWVVKSGSSESNVTLTDSAINAVTNQFIIKDPQGNATIIEGGKINANAITADMITANNLVGDHGWINLKDGKFYYGDKTTFANSNNAISWNGSKLQIKADEFLLASGKSIFDEIDAIETWFYAEAPTTSNEPAKNWTTDNLKEMHLRDVYFDTNTGKSYRWAKDGTTYKWVEIEDKELAAVEGRVAAAETAISSNTEAINLRATKTEVEDTYATKTALADEIKNRKAGYGACATDAATVAKVVTISNFELHTGSTVAIKFNKGNTAAAPTLNVSNTGDKHIVVNGSASPTADQCKWSTNATCMFAYDGTYWRYIGSDEDTKRIRTAETNIDQNAEQIKLSATKTELKNAVGRYATSSTAKGTAAKVATITPAVTDWELTTGSIVTVKFTAENTAATPTLNVNGTGAKQIKAYTGTAALTEAEYKWKAGTTLDFIYDGTYWRIQDSSLATRVSSAEASITVNSEAITARATKTELTDAINQEVKDRDAAIQLSAEGITSTVSSNYTTKTDFNNYKSSNDDAVADAKKAGTDAQTNLNTYKTSNDKAVAAAKKAGTDAQSNLDSYKKTVTNTYASKTELTQTESSLEGKISTAQTTATEYADGLIAEEVTNRDAAIKASADGITSSVSKTYETKTDASAKLTEAKNDATSKANAAEKNAKDDTTEKLKSYYTATQTDSQIEQKADEIATRVSEEKIEGIEIGGRNLAVNSAGNEWYTVTIADGTNKPLNLFGSPSKGYLIIPEISNIKKDDIIQVSFDIKFGENWKETGTGTKASYINGNYNVGGTWASITFQGGNLSKKLPEVMASESREGHLNTYFTVTENMLNGTYTGVAFSNIRFDYYSGDVSIRRVMVEKATKPSNWTPAPEDLELYADAAVSSATTEIKQTTDSITARVAANEIKIAGQYATSSTAADTKAKVATIIPSISDWELYTGATVTVKFTKANTDVTPTLNINNTGAKPIKNYGGGNLTKNEYEWPAGTTMAFVYDGTNWRVQDSTVMAKIKSAETQISQNAEAISLRATKEEAAQMAQPNLSPYFSHTPYSVDDYWAAWINDSNFVVTPKEDGWVRIQRDNSSGTAVVRRDCIVAYNPVIKEGTDYTILLEVRNNNSTGRDSSIYIVQQNNLSFWGADVKKCIHRDDGSHTPNSAIINIGDNYHCIGAGPFETRVVKVSEATGSTHWTGDMVGMMRVAFYCNAGSTIDCEARISIYEGEYSGPYKPYVGDLQFATQSELKVTADGIISSVTSVGAIVNMLPSVYYRENISGNTYVQDGITWTLNPDGSVTATGTATDTSTYYFTSAVLTADIPVMTIDPERTYIVHGCPAGGSGSTYSMRARWTLGTSTPTNSSGKITYDYGDGTVLDPNDGRKYLAVWAYINSGFTCPDGGLTFYPMVESGIIKHGYVSNHIGATAQKLYSTIEQLPDKIESTVSSKYETKTDASAKLTEAKNDATSKANAAEKNAKDDTTEKLKSYYTKTETETKITQDATSIATSVSTQKIAELEIGGRNLFIGTTMSDYNHIINSSSTDFTKHLRYYNGNAQIHNFEEISSGIYQDTFTLNAKNLGIAFVRLASEIDLDHDSYYTISCMAKCSSTDKPLCIGKSYYTTENKWRWRGGTNPAEFTAADTWQKFTLTFKPDADTQAICYCFTASGEEGGTDTLTIKNCKLEKGTKATAWTPAPEDGIAYTDTVVASAKSEIKQTTDAITASVADIEIGGANLLYNSHDMSKWLKSAECDVENNILHIATSQDTARYADTWVIPKYEDVKGRSITISMDVKKTADTPIDGLYIYTVSTGNEYDPTRTATLAIGKFLYTKFDAFKNIEGVNENTWTRVYVTYDTFDFAESTATLYDYVGLRVGLRKITGTREAWFRNIKLEYGNRPTSYSRSSEDILSETSAKIQVESDNISLTVEDKIGTVNDRITDLDDTVTAQGNAIGVAQGEIKDLSSTVEQNASDYQIKFSNYDHNLAYFDFSNEGILTIGKERWPFKMQLSSDKLSFREVNRKTGEYQEVAYVSNKTLHISDAEVINTLRIGNFVFMPRANGNMSLKYSPL